MRKFTFFGLLLGFSFLVFSCSTVGNTTPQQSTEQSGNNLIFLNPEELYGKKMVGYSLAGSGFAGVNRDNIFRLIINNDGSFEFKINDTGFMGRQFNPDENNVIGYQFTFED